VAKAVAAQGQLDRITGFLESHNGQRLSLALFSVVATLVLVAFPGTWAAYVFGVPLIFFVPGFAVVRLFFWKGTSVEAKFVLSLGLSVLVAIFLGLILVFTIGLMPNTTRGSLVVFALGAVALETYLRQTEKAEKQQKPMSEKKQEPFKVDKVVAAMIGTALVVSVICLGLIITAEYPSRTYFAMTNEDGSARINSTYAAGTNLTLIIHMHNGEKGERVFSMVAHEYNHTIFGTRWYNDTLDKNADWNVSVSFDLDNPGVWRLDFDLYIAEPDGEPEFYANLHLWIEVV
jgi:uncharacterized membrane protein